jgi:putative stage III sporulation protein AH
LKKIFKKNQIIITVLALMIAVAGYINYADGVKKKNAAANKTKEVVGTDVDKDLKDVDIAEPGNTVFTSGSTSQFIVSAKLEREQMRASNKQTLLDIINNVNISEAEKTAASEKWLPLQLHQKKKWQQN